MVLIVKNNIDNLTIGEIKNFQKELSSVKGIYNWKINVKDFATKFELKDREAIDISRLNLKDL